MVLTSKQEEGLRIAIQRYKDHEKYTIISGYAGTGKSTLVKFIINALDVDPDEVCYTAFTGKAAEVLRKKGNKNAMTLHKLLYDFFPKKTGGFVRKPKLQLEYSVVVVDEISLAPKSMMDQLFKHNVYVIGLGDPGQLPPISSDDDNHLLDHPDIFLDQIMRQAAESEIIQLTMKIRNGESIPYMKGKEVMIVPKEQLNTGMLEWGDIILCATNAMRQGINKQMRDMRNRGPEPEEGDKVICLRNYWDEINDDGDALVNGSIGTIKRCFKSFRQIPSFIRAPKRRLDILQCEFIPEYGQSYDNIEIDYQMLLTGEKCVDWRLAYQLNKLKMKYGEIVPKEFAWGYAITCHKAQGSEWEKVLVIEEGFPYKRDEHKRWLYTACTRASDHLVLVR